MRRQSGYDTHPHSRLSPSFLAIDANTCPWPHDCTYLWFGSYMGHWCAWLISLTCYLWIYIQPGTPIRPVDWLRNYIPVTVMHQSIESPGGGGPGWGGDSAPTFCTILHSPRPLRHIFLSLIPAPRGTFFKGALKAHIHISTYENNTLQELLFLSVIPWGEIFAYCHHPAQPLEATGCGHVF